MNFYASLFSESRIIQVERYGPGEQKAEGTVKKATFTLVGREFMCIDSLVKHAFTFTPSISLLVDCESEAELEEVFGRLSTGGARRSKCIYQGDLLIRVNDKHYAPSPKFASIQRRRMVVLLVMIPAAIRSNYRCHDRRCRTHPAAAAAPIDSSTKLLGSGTVASVSSNACN